MKHVVDLVWALVDSICLLHYVHPIFNSQPALMLKKCSKFGLKLEVCNHGKTFDYAAIAQIYTFN